MEKKHLWAESLLEVFYRQMKFQTKSMDSRTSGGCLWTKDPSEGFCEKKMLGGFFKCPLSIEDYLWVLHGENVI